MVKWEQIDGWLFKDEPECLQKYAKTTDRIIELGSYKGKSTVCMAEANPRARIFAIDTFKSDGGITDRPIVDTLKIFKDNVGGMNVEPIVCKTEDGRFGWIPGSIGLLFIDAGHSYKDVLRDFNDYLYSVKIGGYIIFHDVYANEVSVPGALTNYGGVYAAFEDILKRHDVEFVEKVQTIGIIRKIKYQSLNTNITIGDKEWNWSTELEYFCWSS